MRPPKSSEASEGGEESGDGNRKKNVADDTLKRDEGRMKVVYVTSLIRGCLSKRRLNMISLWRSPTWQDSL